MFRRVRWLVLVLVWAGWYWFFLARLNGSQVTGHRYQVRKSISIAAFGWNHTKMSDQ